MTSFQGGVGRIGQVGLPDSGLKLPIWPPASRDYDNFARCRNIMIGWIKDWVKVPMHGLGELERGGESVDVHNAGLLGLFLERCYMRVEFSCE